MADNFDCAASSLMCSENSTLCFDDLDCDGASDEFLPSSHHQNHDRNNRSESFLVFSLQSGESVSLMVEREREHLPRDDYLKRLRSGDLDLGIRREALDWILKAHAILNFGPLTVCLSMNYLDRFLSIHDLPKCKTWTVQLLAVACLSIAAKIEETEVPQSVDLQVAEPRFVFDAEPIQRMELLVLTTLEWRMLNFTPFSFLDYFLSEIRDDDQLPSQLLISRSVQLILSTIKVIDLLEFKPSEIAAAVAIFVYGEIQTVDIDKASARCSIHIEKGKLLKCVELIRHLSASMSCGSSGGGGLGGSVPQSPIGVLDAAACLSFKSDEITVGSCANSSSQNDSPDTTTTTSTSTTTTNKRRKIERASSLSSSQVVDLNS